MFCPQCGKEHSSNVKFCVSCGANILAQGMSFPAVATTGVPSEPMKSDVLERLGSLRDRGVLTQEEFEKKTKLILSQRMATPISFQSVSNTLTAKLGLDHVEGFSLRGFFVDTFKKHDPNEVENLFSVGTIATTPALDRSMAYLPSPWVFFRVFVGSLIAYALFYYGWESTFNVKLIPGLIIVGSFAVPVSILILFFEINTPRNISLTRLIQLVSIGGISSILISLAIYDAVPMLGVFGASAAGIVEKCGKLCAVLLVMRVVPIERYPYLLNSMLTGAAVGTGFAAFESAGYALESGFVDSDAMLLNIALRGLMSPFSHIVWTSIAAAAYWRARKDSDSFFQAIRSPKFLPLFGFVVALHFIWNLPFEGPFFIKYWILGFCAWAAILSLHATGKLA